MIITYGGKNIIYITGSELKAKVNPTFQSTLSTPTITIKVLP